MKRTILLLLITSTLSVAFKRDGEGKVERVTARKAFVLLNKIRLNPEHYGDEFGLDLTQTTTRTPLVWNETLAKVAETKALDMANRNYFGHVDPDGYGINFFVNEAGYTLDPDWIQNVADNSFESITVGVSDGEAGIRDLITDEGIPDLGHRVALLGMNEWHAGTPDVGIGFVYAKGSKYPTYMTVIIARHGW